MHSFISFLFLCISFLKLKSNNSVFSVDKMRSIDLPKTTQNNPQKNQLKAFFGGKTMDRKNPKRVDQEQIGLHYHIIKFTCSLDDIADKLLI